MDTIVIDNFFPEALAEQFCKVMAKQKFEYYWPAEVSIDNFHWHIKNCPMAFAIHTHMPQKLVGKLGLCDFYSNSHTHGVYPSKHSDCKEGSGMIYTALYYPEIYWQEHWGGGLYVYDGDKVDRHIDYKGNRLVFFDGSYEHQAAGISPDANYLRISNVLKYSSDIGDGFVPLDFTKIKEELENHE